MMEKIIEYIYSLEEEWYMPPSITKTYPRLVIESLGYGDEYITIDILSDTKFKVYLGNEVNRGIHDKDYGIVSFEELKDIILDNLC